MSMEKGGFATRDRDQLQLQQKRQLVEQDEVQIEKRVSESARSLPQAPVFTDKLPDEVSIAADENLVLSVGVKATPQADVKWNVNGFELKESKNVTVINESGQSTLIVRPPIRYGRYSVTAVNQYGMNTQATRVLRREEEQFEQVEEQVVVRQRLSLPPEFVENAISVSTSSALMDGWELVDEQHQSSRSADSLETVKYAKAVVATEGGGGAPLLPEPLRASTYTEQRYEETCSAKSEVFYEAPSKPGTLIIHEPLQATVATEVASVRSAGLTKLESAIERPRPPRVPPKPITPKIHEASTFTKRKYEEAVSVESDAVLYVPTPKAAREAETISRSEDEIMERKRFRIPVHRTTEPLPKRPFVLKQPEPEIRLKAGEKLVLESKVDSHPESQFKWYQNNFEVKASPHVLIESPSVNESRAVFMKPVSGTYKVVASNEHGSCTSVTRVVTEISEAYWEEESSISAIRPLPEKYEPKYQLVKRPRVEKRTDLPKAPQIVEGFAPMLKIRKDELLELRIVVDAIPEAKFQWLLNNFEVRQSQTVAIESPGPNVSQAVFREPISGRYEVIATNPLGQVSCSGKVLVEIAEELLVAPAQQIGPTELITGQSPVFIEALPSETQISSKQQEFQLSVLVEGTQPFTFRWFANGSLLSNSVEHQMINDVQRSTLVVRKTVVHSVDYAVEASNVYGAVWSQTVVKPSPAFEVETVSPEIVSPLSVPSEAYDTQRLLPRFTTELTSMDLLQDDDFTAHVTIDLDSSPCEFSWTLNSRDVRTIPGFHVESTFYESTLYLKSAKPKHSGELVVTAANKYGSAKSWAKMNVERC
ncbi:unnamed protein product [Gongylonema pulchrum]|uniref:Ig-like domain-containing protein n=1 Tax=Gongylonema pulchrum TaxID=637853 RepID=A0A183DPJ5_9BILA|nr:unnamed protein product [Gongylonema pulchrum]